MKISNRKELQNIVSDHSADIDYNDFMKIYRECTKESFNLGFRKNLFDSL